MKQSEKKFISMIDVFVKDFCTSLTGNCIAYNFSVSFFCDYFITEYYERVNLVISWNFDKISTKIQPVAHSTKCLLM